MPTGHYRFRRSLGNVSSLFRGARPDTFPLFTGLLDDFGGAAAAYSLRALSADHLKLPVVKVRRTSFGGGPAEADFTAGQIDSGAMLSFVTEFSGIADGLVSTWYDQSGQVNDATQATTTMQPKIVSAGSLVVGGLDFDGVDDFMSVIGVPVITASFSGTYSMFGVQTIATGEDGYLYGNASSTNGTSLYANSVPRYTTSNKTATNLDNIGRMSGQDLLSSIYDNGDAGLLVNGAGTMVDANTYNFAAGSSDFIIGNRNGGGSGATFLDGQVAEIIVYNLDQSANRTAIETEMIANYSIS